MNHSIKGANTLLEEVKRGLIFGTILLRSEYCHSIFRDCLAKVLMSKVDRKV